MYMSIKKFFSCLLVFLCFFTVSCTGDKESETEEELIERLRNSVVLITEGESHGSGVIGEITDSEIYIYTAAHVVAGYDQGIITFSSGYVGFADVSCCDEKSDAAILTINKSDFVDDFSLSLQSAEIDLDKYEALSEDDSIYLVGSSVGAAANVSTAAFKAYDYYVPEFDEYLLYLYGDADPGMSGAGAFTADGYLIGLVTGSSDTGEVVCIPIKDYIEAGGFNNGNKD